MSLVKFYLNIFIFNYAYTGKITGLSGILKSISSLDFKNPDYKRQMAIFTGICLILFPFYNQDTIFINGNAVKVSVYYYYYF